MKHASKDFAVVAEEVKTLASQTSHATDDVRQHVQEIRADISGVVDQMRTGAVDEPHRAVHKAGRNALAAAN